MTSCQRRPEGAKIEPREHAGREEVHSLRLEAEGACNVSVNPWEAKASLDVSHGQEDVLVWEADTPVVDSDVQFHFD